LVEELAGIHIHPAATAALEATPTLKAAAALEPAAGWAATAWLLANLGQGCSWTEKER
jgi:hypothetical protein